MRQAGDPPFPRVKEVMGEQVNGCITIVTDRERDLNRGFIVHHQYGISVFPWSSFGSANAPDDFRSNQAPRLQRLLIDMMSATILMEGPDLGALLSLCRDHGFNELAAGVGNKPPIHISRIAVTFRGAAQD